MRRINTFPERVRTAVRKIPKGQVRSYKEVAYLAGSPNAYRAVARVMATNYDPTVPCHRVINQDGTVGGYNRGGPEKKAALLKREGVTLHGFAVIRKHV